MTVQLRSDSSPPYLMMMCDLPVGRLAVVVGGGQGGSIVQKVSSKPGVDIASIGSGVPYASWCKHLCRLLEPGETLEITDS